MIEKHVSRSVKLIILLALTISCTSLTTKKSYEKGLAKWTNIPVSDLIAEWGPPQNIYPLEDGGKVIEYMKETEIINDCDKTLHVPSLPFFRHHFYDDCINSFPEKSVMLTKTLFFIDPNGIITSYQWEADAGNESSFE